MVPGVTSPPSDAPLPEMPALPRWGLGDVVIGFALANVLSAGALVALTALGVGHLGDSAVQFGYLGTVVFIACTWIGMGGWAAAAARLHGAGRMSDDFGLHLRWPADLGIGLVAAVALLALGAGAEAAFRSFGIRSGSNAADLFPAVTSAWHFVLLALIAVVGTPVVEELFFRGLLLRSLLKRRLHPALAIAISSLVFALLHISASGAAAIVAPAVTLLYGAVLAVLAWRTGRLGPGIVAHALVNAVGLVVFALA